jgi:hypothetical protein
VFRRDFEAGMALFNERHSIRLQEFHREMALFFSSFTPSVESFYTALVERFAKKNIIFSSLNYDMMLEEASRQAGLGFHYDTIRDYGSVRILKPHGSLNFWPVFDSMRGCTFEGCAVAFSGPTKPLTRLAARQRCIEDDSLSPAISMYAKGKQVSVCPEFVLAQQMMFLHSCRTASRILILGVRVMPEDNHIWGPIGESAAEVTYFGGSQDKIDLGVWADGHKKKNVQFVDGYFERLLHHLGDIFSR